MAVQYSAIAQGVSMAAGAAKSVLQINPGASVPAELVSLDVSSQYLVTGTPVSLVVEVGTATAAGTGGAVATPKRIGTGVGVATSVVRTGDTTEPAGFVAAYRWTLILPGGPFSYLWPLGREYFLSVSSFNAIRLTASAVVVIDAVAVFEE